MRLRTHSKFAAATAFVLGSVAFGLAFLVASAAHAAQDPTGVWLNDTGRGAIEIKNCNTGLCGHVVWVKAGVDSMGCGKQIIGEVQNAGGGTWDGGWIYNPDKQKRYDVELEPQGNGTLRVTGFAGIRFLSKTMYWKRAPQDLVRCDAAAFEAPAAKTAAAAPAPSAPAVAAPVPAKTAKIAAPAVDAPKSQDEGEVATNDDDGKDGDRYDSKMNLDDGIEVGDVFSMKRDGNGKCKIKAPFVDLVVDCNRHKDRD